jgi:hypothetical protein
MFGEKNHMYLDLLSPVLDHVHGEREADVVLPLSGPQELGGNTCEPSRSSLVVWGEEADGTWERESLIYKACCEPARGPHHAGEGFPSVLP